MTLLAFEPAKRFVDRINVRRVFLKLPEKNFGRRGFYEFIVSHSLVVAIQSLGSVGLQGALTGFDREQGRLRLAGQVPSGNLINQIVGRSLAPAWASCEGYRQGADQSHPTTSPDSACRVNVMHRGL